MKNFILLLLRNRLYQLHKQGKASLRECLRMLFQLNATIGITHFRVVNPTTGFANVLLHTFFALNVYNDYCIYNAGLLLVSVQKAARGQLAEAQNVSSRAVVV